MDDLFLLDIPVFKPEYKSDTKYGWTKYKDELWDLLKETSNGYCMYCYDRVFINNQRRGQIEHGIERNNFKDRPEKLLDDCIPNLGLACENCNEKYKKRKESSRKLSVEQIQQFELGECNKFNCKKMCPKYVKLRMQYIKKGQILIQPLENLLEEDGQILKLQYDLLKGKYIPSKAVMYSEEEEKVIQNHIDHFCLNKPERENREITKYCEDVMDNESLLFKIQYNNLMVDLLREKLKKMTLEQAIKICQIIYTQAYSRNAT